MAQGDLSTNVDIPGSILMPITINKEGDNYEGISMIRPLYGNWLRKNFYFKIQAMGIERCATGVLLGRVPMSAQNDKKQMALFKSMLRAFTSHQSSYLTIPEGFDIESSKIDFDATSVENAIDAEDRRMAKSFLAGFLELGMGAQGGSQALGQDLSTLFLNGIQIYSETVADAVEKTIIRKLVNAKFGKRNRYPQLKATDINNKAGKEKAEIVVMLKNAGLIRPTDQLEDALNRDYNLPEISAEQKARDGAITDMPADQLSEEAIQFSEKNNATTYIKTNSREMKSFMQASLDERVAAFLKKAKKQLDATTNISKRRKIISELPIPGRIKYRKQMRLDMALIAQQSTDNVLKELKLPDVKFADYTEMMETVPFALRDKLQANIDAVIDDQDHELKKRMFFIASQKLDTTDSVNSLIKDMGDAAEKYTSNLSAASTNLVSGTVNSARDSVFQTPEVFDEIESFVIVNPSPQAPICKNLTGRVFTKEEYITGELPPYHHHCETTVRAQLVGQKTIKPVSPLGLTPTGTPAEVSAIIKSKTF